MWVDMRTFKTWNQCSSHPQYTVEFIHKEQPVLYICNDDLALIQEETIIAWFAQTACCIFTFQTNELDKHSRESLAIEDATYFSRPSGSKLWKARASWQGSLSTPHVTLLQSTSFDCRLFKYDEELQIDNLQVHATKLCKVILLSLATSQYPLRLEMTKYNHHWLG